jgi:hypothetical protein
MPQKAASFKAIGEIYGLSIYVRFASGNARVSVTLNAILLRSKSEALFIVRLAKFCDSPDGCLRTQACRRSSCKEASSALSDRCIRARRSSLTLTQ